MKITIHKMLLTFFIVTLSTSISYGYVGSKSCGECHEEVYNRFIEKSLKAETLERVKVMQKKLTEAESLECYTCHTTGYKAGGFVSEQDTPELAHVGCEACHGEGDIHIESEDPDDIVSAPSLSVCEKCHSHSQDKVFKKNALMYSGAH